MAFLLISIHGYFLVIAVTSG